MDYKKILTITLLAFLLVGVNTAFAATKIAFVETSRVLQKSPQVQAVKDKIKKEFARRDDQLVAEQKQLTKLQEKLLKDGSVMSEADACEMAQPAPLKVSSSILSPSILRKTSSLSPQSGLFPFAECVAHDISEKFRGLR